MKTTIATLQGQEFIISLPAGELLASHTSAVRRATILRPRARRENFEALRDILNNRSYYGFFARAE